MRSSAQRLFKLSSQIRNDDSEDRSAVNPPLEKTIVPFQIEDDSDNEEEEEKDEEQMDIPIKPL